MSGKSQSPVKQHHCATNAAGKAYGASTPDYEIRQLRQPSPVHPSRKSYSRQAEYVSNCSQHRNGPPSTSRDPEKAVWKHQHMQSHPLSCQRTTSADTDDEGIEFAEEMDNTKRHAVRILIHLSFLAPFLALPIAIYTLLTTILLLLLSPVFLLLKKRPLSARFYRFLAPPSGIQLSLIFSPYHTGSMTYHGCGNNVLLILVNLFAPLYALLIMFAAWTGGVFWFYTAILGNPDGEEERDDGREAVLWVRGLWERYLLQGLACT